MGVAERSGSRGVVRLDVLRRGCEGADMKDLIDCVSYPSEPTESGGIRAPAITAATVVADDDESTARDLILS